MMNTTNANEYNEHSQQLAARIAGAISALTIVILFPLMGLVSTKLFVAGNTSQIIANLSAHQTLFRISTAFDALMYISVVVLAWSFYVMLRPISRTYALLAMLLRVVEAMIGMVGVFCGIAILLIVNGQDAGMVFSGDQIRNSVRLLREMQLAANNVLSLFLGSGGILFYVLLYQSAYVPRVLAVGGIVAYSLVFVYAFTFILSPHYAGALQIVLVFPVVLLEFAIGLWLYVKGLAIKSTVDMG